MVGCGIFWVASLFMGGSHKFSNFPLPPPLRQYSSSKFPSFYSLPHPAPTAVEHPVSQNVSAMSLHDLASVRLQQSMSMLISPNPSRPGTPTKMLGKNKDGSLVIIRMLGRPAEMCDTNSDAPHTHISYG